MKPDFIIIGAMKCATSTLHEQLARQPGFFMSTPKEPNYFSDDDVFAKGLQWYEGLFSGSEGAVLRGESSTHYTKLPLYPRACKRMKEALPQVKLIYMMRHPMDRLVSHYMHEWTQRVITRPIDAAIDAHPELIAYGQYARQLAPYLEAYGKESILPVFFKHFRTHMPAELTRVCRFLGYGAEPQVVTDLPVQNVSSERLRLSPLSRFVVEQPLLASVRRTFVPRTVRDMVKARFQLRKRPTLSTANADRLRTIFDQDLAQLGAMLGVDLTCENFDQVTANRAYDFV